MSTVQARMMSMLTLLISVAIAAVITTFPVGGIAAAAADSPTCSSGDGCYGQDPHATHCEDDAITVAEQGVTFPERGDFGLLQIRYSPECESCWGRFTAPAGVRQLINLGGWNVTYGRVTAWIPGLDSIQPAGFNPGPGGSSWSGMVEDIGPGVCTGVEVVLNDNPTTPTAVSTDTRPWFWGPCTSSTTAIG